MTTQGAPGVPVPDEALAAHAMEIPALMAALQSSAAGLTPAEAAGRLLTHGRNELREAEPIRPWRIFAAQFKSLLIWILAAAAVVAGLLGEVLDTLAIVVVVLLNAVIGFYQEFSAEKSIAALKQMTAPRAKVRRGGEVSVVAAAEVVPGDVLELEAGDLVAADARLLTAASLRTAEAALTGESETVAKQAALLLPADAPLAERENMVFMGTSVATGSAAAVVIATGMDTEIGRIARLMQTTEVRAGTPLQERLTVLGRMLVWTSLGLVALLFILGLLRGMQFFDVFLTSVSLAVAAVPESLPAVVTIALALGVVRMARRRALIRRLPAVETLGSANVICTDKTGTLTMGEMTVRALYVAGKIFDVTGEGYGPNGEIRFAGEALDPLHAGPLLELANVLVGCNSAHLEFAGKRWTVIGDPTEGAMLLAGHKAGASREQLERDMPVHHEIPFDSDRKCRTVVRLMPNGRLRAFVNGAPEMLLRACTRIHGEHGPRELTAGDLEDLAQRNTAMANQSLRVLGSAYRDLDPVDPDELSAENLEQQLTFVGLTGMYDPPRPEAKAAVAKCRVAGIRVVMITGDHPRTAMAIAREIGIAGPDDAVVSGVELDQLSDADLQARVRSIAVYARVTAEHKLRIVRAWKANEAVVAMTGDGVNDAPAVKGADIGIAMGRTGTEVTKQASDMIIADDNFASIVAAVEEGRGIYDNIRKTLQYLLAGNVGELLLMATCVVIGLPSPLLPIHLLWINLVTDGLPALCLATDPIEGEVMKQPPRAQRERITDGAFLRTLALTGLLSGGVAFAVYCYALRFEAPDRARTYAFTVLVFEELIRSFSNRSARCPIWRMNLLGNMSLLAVVVISVAIQLCILEVPALSRIMKTELISLASCLILFACATLPLLVLELRKAMTAWRDAAAAAPSGALR